MAIATVYNLRQVDALRKKILTDPLIWRYYNTAPTGENFAQFVHDVGRLLGDSVAPRVLEESCMPILGKELTKRRLNAFALRIAANIKRLRRGEVVLPWTKQVEEEWAPVEILRCWPGRNRKGDFHGERRKNETHASPSWLRSKFVCPLGDRTDSPDEAFIRESEWVRREIHFDGFAI